MRTRTLLGVIACSALALGLAAVPAVAAPADSTVVTFELLEGTLDIDAAPTADLGSGAPGTAINGSLGTVAVTDGRASADASWAATVTSTDFSTGAGTPAETVVAGEVDYWSGPATATTGNGTFTPGEVDLAAAVALDNVTPAPAFTHVGGTGNNTAEWSASISVNVPLESEAGIFTGTVTHSVA